MDADRTKPIAAWLRATRLGQKMDDGDGGTKPWTIRHLLALMEAEIGWAPPHPNYSNYENGKSTPNAITLRKFVKFWTKHGQPGPDLSPRQAIEPEPDLAELIKLQTAAIDRQTTMLRAVLEAIAGPALDPDRQAWAQARLAEAIQSPNPTPDHNGERVR